MSPPPNVTPQTDPDLDSPIFFNSSYPKLCSSEPPALHSQAHRPSHFQHHLLFLRLQVSVPLIFRLPHPGPGMVNTYRVWANSDQLLVAARSCVLGKGSRQECLSDRLAVAAINTGRGNGGFCATVSQSAQDVQTARFPVSDCPLRLSPSSQTPGTPLPHHHLILGSAPLQLSYVLAFDGFPRFLDTGVVQSDRSLIAAFCGQRRDRPLTVQALSGMGTGRGGTSDLGCVPLVPAPCCLRRAQNPA